jgi:hypothetical protein
VRSAGAALAAYHPRCQCLQVAVPASEQAIASEPLRIDHARLVTGAAGDPHVGLVLDQVAKAVEASVGGHTAVYVPENVS